MQARALADVDLETLPRKRWSGREVNGTYVPHFGERMEWEESRKANETEGGQSEEKLGDDFVKYYGNCHCGKVRYAVRWKRLEELKVMNCNCSLCSVVRIKFLQPRAPHLSQVLRRSHSSSCVW